jgi:hypothetical protein
LLFKIIYDILASIKKGDMIMNNIDKIMQVINDELTKESLDIVKLNKMLTIGKAVYTVNLKHYLDNKLNNHSLPFPNSLKQLNNTLDNLSKQINNISLKR